MEIKGLHRMTGEDLVREIESGGKFVIYEYCISIAIMTFKQSSSVYFVRAGESAVTKGLLYSLLSFIIGWWGFPWGPIYTIGAIAKNFGGGTDVTDDVVASMRSSVEV